jgi:hypothetical protein
LKKFGLLVILILFISCNINSSSYVLLAKADNSAYIISVENKSLISIQISDENKGNELLDYFNLVPDVIFQISNSDINDIHTLLENLSSEYEIDSSIWQGGIDYQKMLLKSDVVETYSQRLGFDVKPFVEKIANKKAYSFNFSYSENINENNRDHFFLWYRQVLSLSDRR